MGWMVTNHSGQKTKTHRLILIVIYTNYTMFSKLRSYIVQREPMVSRVFGGNLIIYYYIVYEMATIIEPQII